MLSALSLGDSSKTGKIDCDEMEWKFGGGHLFRKLDPTSDRLDSDDDSENDAETDDPSNPLKVLATRELPTVRKTKTASKSEREDNQSSEVSYAQPLNLKPKKEDHQSSEISYAQHLMTKEDETKARTRFAPFKSVELNSEKSKSDHRPLPTGSLHHTPRSDRPIKNREIEVMPLPNQNYERSSVKVFNPEFGYVKLFNED